LNNTTQFINAISQTGIIPPLSIIEDGNVHRFSYNGKPNNTDGWYAYHNDAGSIRGHYGDNHSISETWFANTGKTLTTAEHAARQAQTKAMQQQRETDKLVSEAEAAIKATAIWDKAAQCLTHDYLTRKGVKAYALKQIDGSVVIPLRDGLKIHSLQYIGIDGAKKFLFGGRIKGCYFAIGKPESIIYIAEGYATGASIHEATGDAVVVAFNAGNLLEVAKTIRAKYPTIKLVICADDDLSGVGISKANEAAKQVGASVLLPIFGDNRPDKVTDFNDLHKLKGLDVVKAQLTVIQAPASDLKVVADVTPLLVINGWLPPTSLLHEVEAIPYPLAALPSGLGDAVREVLEFTQCPIALAACSAISALSVSAQHLANVKRAEGLSSPVSLYTLAIAESGERKSSVDKHFTMAISIWEANQAELAKPDVKRYQVEHDSWQMQYDGLKQKIKETAKGQKSTDLLTKDLHNLKKNEPIPVRVPRLIYGDATPEQLGYSLAKQWPSAGVMSSEAGIVFGSHGMSGDSAMRNMALLNVLWDGGTHTIDRRTTDSYKVQDARLTMGLAVQADTVRNFFDNSKGLARGTGFLARFLVAWPTSTQGTRLFKEPPTAWPMLTVFSARITELLNKIPVLTDAGGIEPVMLDFSIDAKQAWITFHNQVEVELLKGGEMTDARDVASKAADNVARLAALFHLCQADSEGDIKQTHVEAAIDIVTWHLYEAKRFLNQIAVPENVGNAVKLSEYILRHCRDHKTDTVTKNHILRNGSIRDKKSFNEAIDELIDANHIMVILDNRTSIIEVNPVLLGGDYA